MNNEAKKGSTVGQIVNLMSVDAQKFQDAPAFLHMVWSAPFTVAVAMYFLWQELGVSSLAGLAVMLTLAPINVIVAQKTRMLQVPKTRVKCCGAVRCREVLCARNPDWKRNTSPVEMIPEWSPFFLNVY